MEWNVGLHTIIHLVRSKTGNFLSFASTQLKFTSLHRVNCQSVGNKFDSSVWQSRIAACRKNACSVSLLRNLISTSCTSGMFVSPLKTSIPVETNRLHQLEQLWSMVAISLELYVLSMENRKCYSSVAATETQISNCTDLMSDWSGSALGRPLLIRALMFLLGIQLESIFPEGIWLEIDFPDIQTLSTLLCVLGNSNNMADMVMDGVRVNIQKISFLIFLFCRLTRLWCRV